jgi:hypothetical protein
MCALAATVFEANFAYNLTAKGEVRDSNHILFRAFGLKRGNALNPPLVCSMQYGIGALRFLFPVPCFPNLQASIHSEHLTGCNSPFFETCRNYTAFQRNAHEYGKG